MNRKRTLSLAGVMTAGLLAVTALTGASSAGAAVTTVQEPPATVVTAPTARPAGAPAPGAPADRAGAGNRPATTAPAGREDAARKEAAPKDAARKGASGPVAKSAEDRAAARQRRAVAAVLKRFPGATVLTVTTRDGGWTVSLRLEDGRRGTVIVNSNFTVSDFVQVTRRHRNG